MSLYLGNIISISVSRKKMSHIIQHQSTKTYIFGIVFLCVVFRSVELSSEAREFIFNHPFFVLCESLLESFDLGRYHEVIP